MFAAVDESLPPGDRPWFRVLVVDDDESVRGFLERALRQPDYEATVAANGYDAIKAAETRGPFDLLVTDLVMPGLQGDELARRLRRMDPELKVLYLTGYSDQLFKERASLWADEAFLDKPVSVRGLVEAVSLILVGRIPPPRPARVHVPGARVRFANRVADLVRVSLTGGLVHAVEEVPVGSTWRLTLELPSETVRVTGRVVSCEPSTTVSPDGAAPRVSYAVALAFVGLSARGRRALQSECSRSTAGPQRT